MPLYTYRREDGTTFELRQKFLDDPLRVDPQTGQAVVRVVQAAGVIFKGSGFYVNDSKNAGRSTLPRKPNKDSETSSSTAPATDAPAPAKAETKSEKPAASAPPAASAD
jgi:predicted nucleic acid-binding Zn ribbon protein